MVAGLDTFVKHFEDHSDHYILIGGSACDWQMEKKGLTFRATKDLDIILIAEALSDEFVNHFWEFIKEGEYSIAEVGNRKIFYRFINPKASGYPKMLELFSRVPDLIKPSGDIYLTDIPTGEEASSLSAILLDNDYYNFTLTNSTITDGLHHANEIALVCLKTKAFLNNLYRREAGQQVQEDDILKHKRDIIRLISTIPADTKIDTPESIKADIKEYVSFLQKEQPDIRPLLRNQGIINISLNDILGQLQLTFGLVL